MQDDFRKKSIGKNIKSIRLSLGLTLDQFSQLFTPATTASIVSKWERGVSLPKPERLKKIAEISGKSIEEILLPKTDEMFLEQVESIKEYYRVHQNTFKQDLSNGYLVKRLATKFLDAGMNESTDLIDDIGELYYTLDLLMGKNYYEQFTEDPKEGLEKGKEEVLKLLDKIYDEIIGTK